MNLINARRMVEYLNSIKTQDYKNVVVGIIHNQQDVKQYGGFCVRIIDTRSCEIAEYYKLSHYNYKSMHEEVRTDFSAYHLYTDGVRYMPKEVQV